MADHQLRLNEGVIDALEKANKRIEHLEEQLAQTQAAQQAAAMTPQQREEAQKRVEGEPLLNEIKKAQSKNVHTMRIDE